MTSQRFYTETKRKNWKSRCWRMKISGEEVKACGYEMESKFEDFKWLKEELDRPIVGAKHKVI